MLAALSVEPRGGDVVEARERGVGPFGSVAGGQRDGAVPVAAVVEPADLVVHGEVALRTPAVAASGTPSIRSASCGRRVRAPGTAPRTRPRAPVDQREALGALGVEGVDAGLGERDGRAVAVVADVVGLDCAQTIASTATTEATDHDGAADEDRDAEDPPCARREVDLRAR